MNKTFLLIFFIVVSALLYFLAPVLTPFLAAALLAYLVDPLVNQLMKLRIPRLLAVIIVFVILFSIIGLLILLFIPLFQNQIALLIDTVPKIFSWLQNTIVPWSQEHFGIQEVINVDTLKTTLTESWAKAGGIAKWMLETVLSSGMTLLAWITNLVLIPVVTFYLLRDWDKVLSNGRKLLPRSIEPTFVKLTIECDKVLSAFIRGQLLVMLALGVIYSVGLTLIGLKIGLIIGLTAGLISIVPYLGFIVGIIAASIAAYVQFGNIHAVFLVWLVFCVGQVIESMYLTPKLVGDRIGLHPVVVIFAVLAGGVLYGFFGVLLALPVASVLMVLMRYGYQRYRHSKLYS